MAVAVVMPRFGWNMETGALTEWLKHDGDTVRAGDMLFTVETDKAVMEVEALDSGTLRIPPDSPSIGEELAIGTILAYLVQPGEPAPFEVTPTPAVQPAAPNDASAPPPLLQHSAASPDAAAQGARNPVPVRPTAAPMHTARQQAISPRARRIAGELGVDWSSLRGSGRSGRIVERDVRAALKLPILDTDADYASWNSETDETDPLSRG